LESKQNIIGYKNYSYCFENPNVDSGKNGDCGDGKYSFSVHAVFYIILSKIKNLLAFTAQKIEI